MRNRPFVILVAALLAACSANSSGTPARPPVPNLTPHIFDVQVDAPASQSRLDDPRPNIIFVLTDDQPYQTVDYMPTVRNVLMAGGVTFTNGFVTTPLCCPSRASILTGEYVHDHQVYTDRFPQGGAQKFNDASTFAVWLHAAGYRTAYYGKYLNDYESLTPAGYVPPGWDDWGAFMEKNLTASEDAGSAQYYLRFTLSENGTITEYRAQANFSADVLTRHADRFIVASRDQPFLLMLGYYNPHSPFLFADRDTGAFRKSTDWTPWRPPDFNEANISDKPAYLQKLSPFSGSEIDTTYTQILRSLLSVDDGVASILNALDKTGLRRKTVIVYLTDNGMTVGDHRFGFSKNCPYEACLRTPYIVYAPGLYAPRTEAHLVANIDLAPTFAEWAGAPIPASVDGTSLVSLLRDPGAPWRDALLIEHWPTEEGIGSIIPQFSGVRTDQWKYVEYSTGEKELYDLKIDPFELNNLARDARYTQIISELSARLVSLEKH